MIDLFFVKTQDAKFTYRQGFQCQLTVHPQDHKRCNKTWITQQKVSLHNLSIRWFLVESPAMKLLRPSSRFSTISSQTNQIFAPQSIRVLEGQRPPSFKWHLWKGLTQV